MTITARYMARFQCVASACEDNCCQGWRVDIDRRRYQILKHEMDGSASEREQFRAGVERKHSPDRTDQSFAHIRMTPKTGSCPFLSATKLCSIQERYGAKSLPDICATYPRVATKVGDRLEVWGTLSCPEVARQCLLHDDAMDLVDAAPTFADGVLLSGTLPDHPTPYQRYLDDLRSTAFSLLSLRQYPIATRLFLLAYLGNNTAPFFNKAAAEVDEHRLAAAIDQVTDPLTIARWHHELGSMPAPERLTAKLVTRLISDRLKVPAGKFRVLVEKTLNSYRAEGVTGTEVDAAPVVSELWAAYAQRRQSWLGVLSDRVDLYFENYTKNFWMREWYAHSSDLIAHAHRLLIRVAVLRFLLFSHPSLLEVAESADLDTRREALDRAAVEVFYQFARAVEHDNTFIDLVGASLVEQGVQTFAHATFLAMV